MCVCVCVYYCLCLFVQRLCVNHWCSSGKNWGKIAMFNVRLCDIVCVCVCELVCAYITVCVCLYSICASTTEVKFPALWFELFVCKRFLCWILSVCVCVCLCVCVCVCVCLCLCVCVYLCFCVSVFVYVMCACICVCCQMSLWVSIYLRLSACLGLIFACDSLFLALSFCLISASNLTYHLYYLLSLLSPFCSSPHLFSVHQLNQDQYAHNCSFMYYF